MGCASSTTVRAARPIEAVASSTSSVRPVPPVQTTRHEDVHARDAGIAAPGGSDNVGRLPPGTTPSRSAASVPAAATVATPAVGPTPASEAASADVQQAAHTPTACQPPVAVARNKPNTSVTNTATLRTRIGLNNIRRERAEWKALLEKHVEVREKARDVELDAQILRGDVHGDVLAKVLSVEKRIVSFLLSSTFTDTEWERNLVLDDVVPYLQEYARQHQFEFRLVEMRFGIRQKASSSHQVCACFYANHSALTLLFTRFDCCTSWHWNVLFKTCDT